MNKRQFLKGMAATAAGIMVPGHVLSGQYEFHQRVSGLASSSSNDTSTTPIYTGPGSQFIQKGDAGLGYYGLVSSSEFISGDVLANRIGLSAGTPIFVNDGWFKYSYQGKICFVAKKPIRQNISWQQIYQVGAVYGSFNEGISPSGLPVLQNATVSIDGHDYVVRLMKGLNQNPSNINSSGYDLTGTHNSEWNRVFYRLHNGFHKNTSNTMISESNGNDFQQWESFSESDLHMDNQNGAYSWCQETPSETTRRVGRGFEGVSYVGRTIATSIDIRHGWRPVLEKVS